MYQTQPLEVKEFHGGITDNFIDNALTKYADADNFLVTVNKKLISRPGSELFDILNAQIPAGAQRVGTIIEHEDLLLVQSSKKLYNYAGTITGWATLTGPTGNDAFTAGSTTSIVSYAKWNHHLYVTNSDFAPVTKIYKDIGGIVRTRTAGLPQLGASPSVVSSGPVGTNSYIYAFAYYYSYTVGTLVFEDYGTTLQVQLADVDEPSVNAVNITAIPVLANGSNYNYDTSNIKVKIYRTISGGTVFYEIGEVTNGTLIFNDNQSDASIQDNVVLYTEGGVLDNDPPPLAKYIHVSKGICWYAHIKEGTEIATNRIRQSIQDDPDSCPIGNYVDVEDEITGLSSCGFIPVVFCKNSVYRLDGYFDELGGGALIAQRISDYVGCISSTSVVQTEKGVFFAGKDGFYFTDAYNVFKISEEFNDRYTDFSTTDQQKSRIFGAYDKENNRIWWSVQTSDGADCDKCFVLDLRWGINTMSCFTTATGSDSFAPTSILFYQKQLIRGDTRGFIFKHSQDYLSDPKVDLLKAVADWDRQEIIWNYVSCATSFGNTMIRKWVPWILFYADNRSNLSIQMISNNDVNKRRSMLTPIRFRKNLYWGDPLPVWRDDELVWNYAGLIELLFRFNAGGLRCSYKQIEITNAFVNIVASDDMTTATVDSAAKTVLLDDIVTYKWPENLIDYYIYFDNDNYANEYKIISRSDDTLVVLDPENALVSGSRKWVIKGYPKDEMLYLMGYTLHYAMFGQTQQGFDKDSLGDNA